MTSCTGKVIKMKVQLRKLSDKALAKLDVAINDEFIRRKEIEKAKQYVQQQIKASGFSMSELVGEAGKRKYTRKNKVKWVHKLIPTKTWTGYGRPPKWLKRWGVKK